MCQSNFNAPAACDRVCKFVLLASAFFLAFHAFSARSNANDKLSRVRGAVRAPAKPAVARPAATPSKPHDHDQHRENESRQQRTPAVRVAKVSRTPPPTAQRNGKLNSVRSATRQSTPVVHHDDHGHGQGHDRSDRQRNRHQPYRGNRHRSQRRFRGFNGTPFFAPAPLIIRQNLCPPEVIVVPDPYLVPVYPSQDHWDVGAPIVQSEPLLAPAVQPIFTEPPATVDVANQNHNSDYFSHVGTDWFDSTDSRFWASIGSDFDGITIGSLGLQLQAAQGFGLDVGVSTLRESGTDLRDNLWLGDVNLMYQVIRRQRFKTRLGVGVNWLGDRWGGEAGLNLTAAADLKLSQRWGISAEGDIGTLGDSDFLHTKISLNRQFESAEWMIGYERYDIGGTEIGSVFTGFGVRF